nr:hypothetical protein [Tanacetum cinerariifolium]
MHERPAGKISPSDRLFVPVVLIPGCPALPCKVSSLVEVETLHLGLFKPNSFFVDHVQLFSSILQESSCPHSQHSNVLPQALDSQNKYLNTKVNALQDLNEHFRAKNKTVKQHYKELYDSIKLIRAKTIEKTTSLLTKIETLKIKGKTKCITMPDLVKLKVLSLGLYAIDVEPIPPRNRNNREVHLDYLKHLKENVETLREIVEEAMAEKTIR